MTRKIFLGLILCLCLAPRSSGAAAFSEETLPPGLAERGGLCVVLGTGGAIDGAVELAAAGPWLVHLLERTADRAQESRAALRAAGFYGRVTAEHWEGPALPYADNLVNLLVAGEGWPVDEVEIMRVIAPGGHLLSLAGGAPAAVEKPRPPEMGEWTHPWHDADGSLASRDLALEAPNSFQWIAGPPFPLDARKDSAGVILSAGGRVFYITRNVPENLAENEPSPDYLVARDAFNGLPLWSRPWEGPLSRSHHFAVHEAIVVTAERVYASRGREIAVLDASDGREIALYPVESGARKLLLSGGILVAEGEDALTAFDTGSGEMAWRHEAEDPWNAVVYDQRVFCLSSTREIDGRWRHEMLAVCLRTGERLWTSPVESEHGARNTAVLRIHFAGGGAVCLVERKEMRAISAEDGRELWRRESDTEARGGGSMDSRQVGHFFAHGLVWMRMERGSGRDGEEGWLGLDPLTGEVRRELAATGDKGVTRIVDKVSCQPLTATGRFVFDARLSTTWDFETGERSGWKFARGGCQVGMVPANGMAYAPPNACGCLYEQLRANLAIVRSHDEGVRSMEPGPLVRGPAWDDPSLGEDKVGLSDWPMYRRDGLRGAWLPDYIAPELSPRWETKVAPASSLSDPEWNLRFGRPLSPPAVAAGLVLLADPRDHRVLALDAETGEKKWQFTTGGRVTMPPAAWRGMAFVGAHDGFLYALRLSDGVLAWRRRVAPSDRRIIAYGQLESSWPVEGGALVHDGLVFAAAGRATDADGGIIVRAFEPLTGEVAWSRRVDDARYGTCEPLVTDGRFIYLMDKRFEPRTGEVTSLDFRYRSSERGGAHLFYPEGTIYLRGGNAGLLEKSWTRLAMGLRKAQLAWSWGTGVEGEILAFTGDRAFAFHVDILDPVLRSGNPRMWSTPQTRGGGLVLGLTRGEDEPAWVFEIPRGPQVEAMVTTDEILFVAGPEDRLAPEGPGFLFALGQEVGDIFGRMSLPAAPVHDGIAAAGDGIFAVLRDGRVIRLGP